jgi:hypothetical protein
MEKVIRWLANNRKRVLLLLAQKDEGMITQSFYAHRSYEWR